MRAMPHRPFIVPLRERQYQFEKQISEIPKFGANLSPSALRESALATRSLWIILKCVTSVFSYLYLLTSFIILSAHSALTIFVHLSGLWYRGENKILCGLVWEMVWLVMSCQCTYCQPEPIHGKVLGRCAPYIVLVFCQLQTCELS